jgi:hypothetical protein
MATTGATSSGASARSSSTRAATLAERDGEAATRSDVARTAAKAVTGTTRGAGSRVHSSTRR